MLYKIRTQFITPPPPFRNVKPYSTNPIFLKRFVTNRWPPPPKVVTDSLALSCFYCSWNLIGADHSFFSCYGFCERSLTWGDIFLIWNSLVKTTSIHSFILRLFTSDNFAFKKFPDGHFYFSTKKTSWKFAKI